MTIINNDVIAYREALKKASVNELEVEIAWLEKRKNDLPIYSEILVFVKAEYNKRKLLMYKRKCLLSKQP